MKRSFCLLCFFFFLFLCSGVSAFAQNKAGINIGDHFNDFDKAASIVGSGGWIVIMACPGDGDKIAKMISDHPEINIVIRGHYPGYTPNELLAKLWAATLKSISTPNKIYFMPWNEPNQEGSDDYVTQSELIKYIEVLQKELAPVKSRVFLLSPMINITHHNFDLYVSSLVSQNFFSQFDGIAFNLYDTCNGKCNDPHQNPLYSPQLLSQIGASGKKIFGVESGTAGNFFYFNQPPSANSPLYKYVNNFLSNSPSEIAMIGIPSYDLAGEVGHSWSLFDPPDVTNLLKSAPDGSTTPASGSIAVSLPKCPGKAYSFYLENEGDCSECGGSISSICKPINENQEFGDELSKNSLNIPEQAKYDYFDPKCITANFNGKVFVSGLEIPFANELNKYFLGPYVDNLKTRTVKKPENRNYFDTGAFEKLAPKALQDQLKLKFIEEVKNLGAKSRYFNYRIEGKDLNWISSQFKKISEKQKKYEILTDEEKKFLKLIWPQVPLFANEESEGEVIFYGSGFEKEKNRLKTSVPETYRLNKVTQYLHDMLAGKQPSVKNASVQRSQVLSTNSCPVTNTIPIEISNKETLAGRGNEICTKPEIQEKENPLEGSRIFINDATESCSAGGCDFDPLTQNPSDVLNRCCGNQGKCLQDNNGNFYCEEKDCESCWGYSTSHGCCVPDYREKTKEFTDTNLNSKNRVPYLNKIAQYAVGKSGFFRIFIPFSADQTEGETKNAFREVAGESKASINIEFNPPTVDSGVSFKVDNVNGQIDLLFHKLGTLLNVKNFISGKVLWPYRIYSEFFSSNPGVLDYTIEFKNKNIVISDINKSRVIASVKASWPNSKIQENWDLVYNQAVSNNWNPAFVIALWIEESGASGVSAYDLGCLGGNQNDIDSQLDCLFNQTRSYNSGSFEQFMCMYSEGKSAPCSFVINPFFPANLKYWYNQLTQ